MAVHACTDPHPVQKRVRYIFTPDVPPSVYQVQDEGVHMRLQLGEAGEDGRQWETGDEVREKEEADFLRSTACVVICGPCRGKLVDKPW